MDSTGSPKLRWLATWLRPHLNSFPCLLLWVGGWGLLLCCWSSQVVTAPRATCGAMASCCGRPSVWECVLILGWPISRPESRWRKVKLERCRPGDSPFILQFLTSSPSLVARLQDGLSSALSRRRVQSDAALLAVQPWRTTKVLRSAAWPRCHQKEVMASVLSPLNGRDALKNKRWWHHAPSHQECRCHGSGRQQRFRTVSSWVCVGVGVLNTHFSYTKPWPSA